MVHRYKEVKTATGGGNGRERNARRSRRRDPPPFGDSASGKKNQERSFDDLFQPYGFDKARADAQAVGEGVSTGFPGLDENGFRLRPGNVYSYAGRQGEGKTALLVETMMRVVGSDPGASVLFVTFEGHRFELYLRLLLRQVARNRVEEGNEPGTPPSGVVEAWLRTGEVPYKDETRPYGNAAAWERELEAAKDDLEPHFTAHRVVLIDGDDVPSENGREVVTMSRLREALSRAPRRPTLVIVDYFQKVRPDDSGKARQEQLQGIADQLRRFSKGGGDSGRSVPVLTAAQVNREAARYQPRLEHIREADDLANDGAGVVTLHLPDTDERVKRMTLKVVKNRQGPVGGRFELDFHGAYGYFAEVDPGSEKAARETATRSRIEADVAKYYGEASSPSLRGARQAVRGDNTLIDECFRKIKAKRKRKRAAQ